MNCAPDNHFGQQPSSSEAPLRPRLPDAGIARGPGLLVMVVTAGVVFLIGRQLFPVRPKPPAGPPPAPVTSPPPTTSAPPPPPEAGASDAAAQAGAAAADAGLAGTNKIADAAVTPDAIHAATKANDEEREPAKPAAEPAKSEPEATATTDRKAADKQDKDLAREAWRHNRPDVSVVGNKTSIMVPIRGSTRGADFKILNRPRAVIVTLPRAVSMVTMKVYNLKHPLFRKVWIDQDEANAHPSDGSKLRFMLSPQTYDPQVEITDDFVRVTIRRPDSDTDKPTDSGEARPEKRRDRAVKHADSATGDEAPSPEKEKESD